MTILLNEYLTSSGSYPDRAKSKELTPELISNANKLLEKVNFLLNELGVTNVKISSGFRTSTANAGIANAAKKSAHMSCLAIDVIDDKDQTLGKLVASKPELLRKYGLMIEDLGSTKGKNSNWVHLDCVDRTDRPSRSFKP
jgi:uncharacterized protein YcbK (DUF882 family)